MNTLFCQQGASAIVCGSVSITSHQSHSFHTHSTLQHGGFPSTPCCSQTLPPCLCNHDPSGQILLSFCCISKTHDCQGQSSKKGTKSKVSGRDVAEATGLVALACPHPHEHETAWVRCGHMVSITQSVDPIKPTG